MIKVIKMILLLIIVINVVSCSSKIKFDAECEGKLKFLKSKLILLKNEEIRMWKYKFNSTEYEEQRKEFYKLSSDINLKSELDCLIGLDKDIIIHYLGKPSNDYINRKQYALFYYIKHNPKCGFLIENHSDLDIGKYGYCELIIFDFDLENDKIKSISFQ